MPDWGWTNKQTGQPTGWADPLATAPDGSPAHFQGNPNQYWLANDGSIRSGNPQAGRVILHDDPYHQNPNAAAGGSQAGKWDKWLYNVDDNTYSVYDPGSKGWVSGKSLNDFLAGRSDALKQQAPDWYYGQQAQQAQDQKQYTDERQWQYRVNQAQTAGQLTNSYTRWGQMGF